MNRHVLLIEDEPNIAEAIRFLLTRGGYGVSCRDTGHLAVDAIRNQGPDLVILDLMLPGEGGIEILRQIRADPALHDLPVIMLTAKGQSRDREAAELAGASLFMAKPFSNAEILAAVRRLAPQ
jgi:two-component system OmpR family response regulator